MSRQTMLAMVFVVIGTSATLADDGERAFSAGRYAEARKAWLPLAEAGNHGAQYGLGRLYEKGLGVSQDDVQAYFWFNLAAVAGNEEYSNARDILETRMSPKQLYEAERLSEEWMSARKPQPEKDCKTVERRVPRVSRRTVRKFTQNHEGRSEPEACKTARIEARKELSAECREAKGFLRDVRFEECECEDLSGRSDRSIWCDVDAVGECEVEDEELIAQTVCE